MKLPEWLFEIVVSAPGRIVVASLAVLLPATPSPPPETLAVFVTVGGASVATFTVMAIGG